MRRLPPPALAAALTTLVLAAPLASVTPSASAGAPTTTSTASVGPAPRGIKAARPIAFQRWTSDAELAAGKLSGTRLAGGKVVIGTPVATRTVGGRRYDVGRWTSPWTAPGFALTELVSSWQARTPGSSWIEVQVRGRTADGTRSSWDVLGRWAATDKFHRRSTVSPQDDDLARVDVDTWKTAGLGSYQVRVQLMRCAGGRATPWLQSVTAVASRLPQTSSVPTSRPGPGRGVVLDVPRYSQMVHTGDYRQWGGGGEAWCSPTSTSMVLGYYDALPKPAARAWVAPGHVDPWVDHAARSTYDASYGGTGNWPFNTAYAALTTEEAFVTRLRSLREAERLVAAGIPVVTSVSFGRGELDGAPISSTNGHLLVVVGFTDTGDVVVNDPAASTRSGVRRVYDRAQFENVWLPTSGGLAYVIRDAAHPLPPSPGTW